MDRPSWISCIPGSRLKPAISGSNVRSAVSARTELRIYGDCVTRASYDLTPFSLGVILQMDTAGDQVYALYQAGKLEEINDYCICDVLDTYFVFLRSRVLGGELTLAQEQELVVKAKEWIVGKAPEMPALQQYLANWGDWQPWP